MGITNREDLHFGNLRAEERSAGRKSSEEVEAELGKLVRMHKHVRSHRSRPIVGWKLRP